ncbi:MAG TPA: hypothetical protein VNK50_13555 [Calidithermus sp.]|nr:hypothetical protein [Calidithermus sp.]
MKVLRRPWLRPEGWFGTQAGLWAWWLQRAAAVGLVVAVVLHLANPFRREVQAALLALVLVHGLLGVRALVLDFGVPVRWHRPLFAGALALAAALWALVWAWRWY